MLMFPISGDPPEGGTSSNMELVVYSILISFQFLGIPPKGELPLSKFSILSFYIMFPISGDPPEGGTSSEFLIAFRTTSGFQFLGIPPKGEQVQNF